MLLTGEGGLSSLELAVGNQDSSLLGLHVVGPFFLLVAALRTEPGCSNTEPYTQPYFKIYSESGSHCIAQLASDQHPPASASRVSQITGRCPTNCPAVGFWSTFRPSSYFHFCKKSPRLLLIPGSLTPGSLYVYPSGDFVDGNPGLTDPSHGSTEYSFGGLVLIEIV